MKNQQEHALDTIFTLRTLVIACAFHSRETLDALPAATRPNAVARVDSANVEADLLW